MTTGENCGAEQPPAAGFTIAICTHNGAARLPRVLEAIAALDDPGVPVEVLVVDNASTDDTAAVAHLQGRSIADMRVVREPRLGLSHARSRAFAEARFEYVAFLDDDNCPRADWLAVAQAAMTSDSDENPVAVGGDAVAVWPIGAEPDFFRHHQRFYACGPQALHRGPLDEGQAFLRGAGLVVRLSAVRYLQASGFSPRLLGRTGTQPASCEDVELCAALRIAGGLLYYEPSMVLEHLMPESRASWAYLVGLQRGNGMASVTLDAYWAALGVQRARNWYSHSARTARHLAAAFIRCIRERRHPWDDLEIVALGTRLGQLLRSRGRADALRRELSSAEWVNVLKGTSNRPSAPSRPGHSGSI